MPIAYTRAVSPALPACALTHMARAPIDIVRAVEQHAAYEAALVSAGCTLDRLPALPAAPDGVFVEDTALLLGDHAIIMRPGAASRTGETASVAAHLRPRFALHHLAEGALDGGDVLVVGATLFVGRSSRSNAAGARSLAAIAAPLGFAVVPVAVHGCLHLKTAVTFLGPDPSGAPHLLVNADWIDTAPFSGLHCLDVAPGEPFAANTLRIGPTIIATATSLATAARLSRHGYEVTQVDIGELQKAEAGLTCLSLIA